MLQDKMDSMERRPSSFSIFSRVRPTLLVGCRSIFMSSSVVTFWLFISKSVLFIYYNYDVI